MIEAYMNATLDVLRLAGQMFLQRIDYELRRFAEDLHDFIYDLDRHPRPDWRQQFDAFLADQTARGREITPESRGHLIEYLELWERNVFGGPPQNPKADKPGLLATTWDVMSTAVSIASNTMELYPEYLVTQLKSAGNRIVETGSNSGTFVGDHLSQTYYDPAAEVERIQEAAIDAANLVIDLALYAYQDPSGAAGDLRDAAIDYLQRLTNDPTVSGELLGDFTVGWATGGASGSLRQSAAQAFSSANRLSRLPKFKPLPVTLEPLRERIDYYAYRAQKAAFDTGLSGTEAGKYADNYFRRAIHQLKRRLEASKSEYGVIWEHGRDSAGIDLPPYYRPAGSLFLDATVISRDGSRVFSGWDIRFQSTPYPRWNTAAQNAAYVSRFQIEEGFVREISVEAKRP